MEDRHGEVREHSLGAVCRNSRPSGKQVGWRPVEIIILAKEFIGRQWLGLERINTTRPSGWHIEKGWK
jgi:hypothetical protein